MGSHAPDASVVTDDPSGSSLRRPSPPPRVVSHSSSKSDRTSSKSDRTSSRSDRASQGGSTSGSSGPPQIITPSSSVYVTPDGLTPINPFALLSIDPPQTQDEHRPLLTTESLRLHGGGRAKTVRMDTSTSTQSAQSVASSSEAKDSLGPLPVARPGMPERPSSRIVQQHHQQQQQQHQQLQERYQRHLVEQQQIQLAQLAETTEVDEARDAYPTSPAGPSRLSPRFSPNPSSPMTSSSGSFRIPLPSPPAMGLSELLSGSPVTPGGNETSYFAGNHSDPSSLSRSTSGRRQPAYSPFRSYYGPSVSDHPRRSELEQQRSLSRPPITPIDSSSSLITVAPRREGSETGSNLSATSNKSSYSPRVKNKGVLAPHGSFTSVRRASDKMRVAGASSDSALYLGNIRKPVNGVPGPARDALQAAAFKGDQLAMYRLGWKADAPTGQKYKIGSIENVWGPVE